MEEMLNTTSESTMYFSLPDFSIVTCEISSWQSFSNNKNNWDFRELESVLLSF